MFKCKKPNTTKLVKAGLLASIILIASAFIAFNANQITCKLLESEHGNQNCKESSPAPVPSKNALQKAQDALAQNKALKEAQNGKQKTGAKHYAH